MITQLHEELSKYQPKHGLFVSAYDENKDLLFSQGSWKLAADEILDSIYDNHIQQHIDSIHTITLHIVSDVQVRKPEDIKHIDIQTTGIGIHESSGNQGAILPHTLGIQTIQDALAALKKQANLHGKAELVTFSTTDISFTIPHS